MKPSSPTFSTPARSEMSSPIAASRIGVVRISAAASHAVSNGPMPIEAMTFTGSAPADARARPARERAAWLAGARGGGGRGSAGRARAARPPACDVQDGRGGEDQHDHQALDEVHE